MTMRTHLWLLYPIEAANFVKTKVAEINILEIDSNICGCLHNNSIYAYLVLRIFFLRRVFITIIYDFLNFILVMNI